MHKYGGYLKPLVATAVSGWMLAAAAAPAVALPAGPARSVEPPQVLVGPPPLDGPPGPEFPTKQNNACQGVGVMPYSDLNQPPPPDVALNLPKARALSTGSGVTVAVIDTGVNPTPRLPNLVGGGDYVAAGGDGLSDCDAHGTQVAGIIAGAKGPADAFQGVAPDAKVLSVRYKSAAFKAEHREAMSPAAEAAVDLRTMARAIVHAANLGAGVIAVTLPVCMKANEQLDQSMLSAAIGYAVHVRGALMIAAAGDNTQSNCDENPPMNLDEPNDPRNWRYVKSISTPGWFLPDVLAVGFTTAQGVAMDNSMPGPWLALAAPGTGIHSLGPGSTVINGVGAGNSLTPLGGSSFAAAYVAGISALLRSRFPSETPSELASRLLASAHRPARGIDNQVGAGVVDPLAALSFRTPPKAPAGIFQSRILDIPPPARAKDHKPAIVATIVIAVTLLLGGGAGYAAGVNRKRQTK